MSNILESFQRLFTHEKPLPPGLYHYQAPPNAPVPYRLHLRLEPDGHGLLIVNASTVLHMNQTAAEFAYHLVMQTPEEQMVSEMTKRYRVNYQQVRDDYRSLNDRILSLVHTPDLDPETFLDFERTTPHTHKLSAPYRLDCALTYRLPSGIDSSMAPTYHVTRELTTQEWIQVFDKAWTIGIPHIILTGGEPTLREDLPELIAHTETNGQVVGVLSDGLMFVDNEYLQTLLQTGLDHLMMSINPDDEKSWQALNNVLGCDLFVAVHLTITQQNAGVGPQVLKRLSSMGVEAVSLSASEPAYNKSLIELRNLAASLGLSLVWDLPVPYSAFNPVALETEEDHPPTGSGHAWLYIAPDGEVYPEQGDDHMLGNILSDSWEKLWPDSK